MGSWENNDWGNNSSSGGGSNDWGNKDSSGGNDWGNSGSNNDWGNNSGNSGSNEWNSGNSPGEGGGGRPQFKEESSWVSKRPAGPRPVESEDKWETAEEADEEVKIAVGLFLQY